MKLLIFPLLTILTTIPESGRIPIKSQELRYKYEAALNNSIIQRDRANAAIASYNLSIDRLAVVRTELFSSQSISESDYDVDPTSGPSGEFIPYPTQTPQKTP